MKSKRSFSEVNVIFDGGYTEKSINIMFVCELSKFSDYYFILNSYCEKQLLGLALGYICDHKWKFKDP